MTSDSNTPVDSVDTAPSKTMSALVQTGYGDPAHVLAPATVDRPEAGPDQVLVEVRAASVNTPDWIAVTGIPYVMRLVFGLRGPKTPVRGTDLSGVVAAVGEGVTEFEPGDEVLGSSTSLKLTAGAGTFAQYCLASPTQLVAKPPGLSFEHAAAVAMSGVTALISVRDEGEVGPGTRILINGASGGVGTLAVQIAKARGAHVTGVCSSANAELVRSLGADEVIDYNVRDFTTEQDRYDVVLDNVLNRPPKAVARVLSEQGILVPNSVGSGGKLLAGLPRMARAFLLRLTGTKVHGADCKVDRTGLTELVDLMESGELRMVIDSVHQLADGAEAVSRMLSHRARGNIIIVP